MRALMFACLVAATGCVLHIDGDGPDLLDEAIRDTAAEVNVHHALLPAAGDMVAVHAEVARHELAMADRVHVMDHRLRALRCADWGGMDALESLVDAVEERHADYVAEMAGVVNVAAAGAACDRYGDDMDDLLGRMMDRWIMMDCDSW